MTRLILYCVAVTYALVAVTCYPTSNKKSRGRRQLYSPYGAPSYMEDEDARLMKEIWNSPVGIGFFINPKGAGGDSDPTRTIRNQITSDLAAGSGGGAVEYRRDEILTKPTHQQINKNEENIITGEMKSKVIKDEKIVEKSVEDPGDKRKIRKSTTCQGQKEWLQCDGPYELIKIDDAFWGRNDTTTCTKTNIVHGLITDKNCVQDKENTLRKVREACDNENVCEVVASDIYFDRSDCENVYKFLKLKWQCAPSESRVKDAN